MKVKIVVDRWGGGVMVERREERKEREGEGGTIIRMTGAAVELEWKREGGKLLVGEKGKMKIEKIENWGRKKKEKN